MWCWNILIREAQTSLILEIILFLGLNSDPSPPDEAKWLTLADCYAAASCTTNRLCIHIPSNPILSLQINSRFPRAS